MHPTMILVLLVLKISINVDSISQDLKIDKSFLGLSLFSKVFPICFFFNPPINKKRLDRFHNIIKVIIDVEMQSLSKQNIHNLKL